MNYMENYEKQMMYAKDALVLAVMAGASEENLAFKTAGSVIGMCIYQPATSETATCWGSKPISISSAGTT